MDEAVVRINARLRERDGHALAGLMLGVVTPLDSGARDGMGEVARVPKCNRLASVRVEDGGYETGPLHLDHGTRRLGRFLASTAAAGEGAIRFGDRGSSDHQSAAESSSQRTHGQHLPTNLLKMIRGPRGGGSILWVEVAYRVRGAPSDGVSSAAPRSVSSRTGIPAAARCSFTARIEYVPK